MARTSQRRSCHRCLNKESIMNRQLLTIMLCLWSVLSAYSIPAKPGKSRIAQPDGTMLTIMLHGDEFSHVTTTEDSYTVVRTGAGYQYAVKKDGVLVPSGIVAHDASERAAEETAFLATQTKMVRADRTDEELKAANRARSLWKTNAATPSAASKSPLYDYDNFHGLVLLVEFSDKKFSIPDANAFFSSLVNDEGYTGYANPSNESQWEECTGSVRDYFSDNTMGRFKPTFDVVGPITINRSCEYPQGGSRGGQCAYDALLAANAQVDFSKYDRDGDGIVDMFYVIYAGYGSHVSGNNENYMWPHASTLLYNYIRLDNVFMGRYACSTELNGSEVYNQKTLDGIGTICHEFSHVLGLPDLYDTDYSENGQSNDPGEWSIMAGGGYLNNSRTPAGYGSYERYAIGFMQPQLITEQKDGYELQALGTSNEAYRINSAVDKEYFLLENRQRTKWDAYLPGTGMLIFRVDSTDASVWNSNKVNCDPAHNYCELVRANPRHVGGASGYDPFPGMSNVIEINNETTPALLSWTGQPTSLSLYSITENAGVISFGVGGAEVAKDMEDFEGLDITTTDASGLQGVFCNWDLTSSRIVSTTEEYGTGSKMLGMVSNGFVTSSPIALAVSKIEMDIWNPSTSSSVFMLGYSADGGKTWTQMKPAGSQIQLSVPAKSTMHVSYSSDKLPANSMLRLFEYKGSASVMTYIDNIQISYTGGQTTDISDVVIEASPKFQNDVLYNLNGQRVAPGTKGLLIRNGKKYISK